MAKGIWGELSSGFMQRSRKAAKITPRERKDLKKLKKVPKIASKYGRDINFTNAVYGKPRKKKELDVDKIKKHLKGKKGKKIIIIRY